MRNAPLQAVFCLWTCRRKCIWFPTSHRRLTGSPEKGQVWVHSQITPWNLSTPVCTKSHRFDLHQKSHHGIRICAGCELFIETVWAVLLTCYSSSYISFPFLNPGIADDNTTGCVNTSMFLQLWQKCLEGSGFGNRTRGLGGLSLHQEANNQCS